MIARIHQWHSDACVYNNGKNVTEMSHHNIQIRRQETLTYSNGGYASQESYLLLQLMNTIVDTARLSSLGSNYAWSLYSSYFSHYTILRYRITV